MAVLLCSTLLRHSAKPDCGAPGLAVLLDEVRVELRALHGRRRGQQRVPVLVPPGSAEGVPHRGQRCHDLTPAGQAAQADALHPRLGAVELGGDGGDVLPGRLGRHREALGLHEVLAVHEERGLAVERLAVDLAVLAGQGLLHGLEDVGLVEGGVLGDRVAERGEPAVLGVERDLVVAERRDVVLAGLGGELLADLVADVVLRQHRVVDRDAGLLGEVVGRQLLQGEHLRVVHHQHVDGLSAAPATARAPTAPTAAGARTPCGHDGDDSGSADQWRRPAAPTSSTDSHAKPPPATATAGAGGRAAVPDALTPMLLVRPLGREAQAGVLPSTLLRSLLI